VCRVMPGGQQNTTYWRLTLFAISITWRSCSLLCSVRVGPMTAATRHYRGSQRASERRFGNYATDTREPDLQTLVTLARVLAITTDELLGVAPESRGTNRDRLLAQIEAALSQISDSDLGLNYNFSSNSYFITITQANSVGLPAAQKHPPGPAETLVEIASPTQSSPHLTAACARLDLTRNGEPPCRPSGLPAAPAAALALEAAPNPRRWPERGWSPLL
jgi:hypothetical protein